MGSASNYSVFDAAEYVEPDGIFDVLRRYAADPSPEKVNVSAGAYRDGEGKPWFLPSVQMAKKKIAGSDHEYSPMMGFRPFRDACYELLLHGTSALAEGRVSHQPPRRTQLSAQGHGALSLPHRSPACSPYPGRAPSSWPAWPCARQTRASRPST